MEVLIYHFDPEISDDELARLPTEDIASALDRLVREKRCPSTYRVMQGILSKIQARMSDISNSNTFENHIAAAKTLNRWRQLEATVLAQLEWMRRQVVIDEHDMRRLLGRWLIIRFAEVESPKMELDGFKIVGGIIIPKGARSNDLSHSET
jgi:hypothetical protein